MCWYLLPWLGTAAAQPFSPYAYRTHHCLIPPALPFTTLCHIRGTILSCRRYYQPPAMPRDMDGFTGREGAPLWKVLIPFLSIIGASLGLAFSWATGCHYGVYIAMFGESAASQHE